MNKGDLFRLMNHRIREIEMLIDALQAEEQMHEIDIDLLMSKIRALYSDAKSISTIKADVVADPQMKEEVPAEPEIEEEVTVEPEIEEEVPVKPEIEEEIPVEPEIEEEVPVEPEIEEEVPVEPELEEEVPVEPEAEEELAVKPVSGEEVQKQTKLYNEPKEKILTGIKMQAVEDIMVAIGLNDRFLFTRELFNNDSELFSSTIKALNAKESWEDAVAYLESRFDWDSQDPTLVLFLSFVKRRFIR